MASILTDPSSSPFGSLAQEKSGVLGQQPDKKPDEPASDAASPDVVKRVKAAIGGGGGNGGRSGSPSPSAPGDMPKFPPMEPLPPEPKQENTPPMEAWGSIAMLAAALGGAFTRTHATTALNAAGAAMQAIHQGDEEKFKHQMETWKIAAENQQRMQTYEIETYRAIIDRKDKDWLNQLHAQSIALQNANINSLIESRDEKGVLERVAAMEKAQKAGKDLAREQDDIVIAQGIMSGREPPVLTGLYRDSPTVKAELERNGFDLSKAQLEFEAAKKQVSSLNSAQNVRFNGLAVSVVNTIDETKLLARQMKLSGVPALNSLQLRAYMQTQGNSERGQLVAKYLASVNTVKEEYAQLANGGYAPIEAAWKLADEQVNANYGDEQLVASLDEIQRLINYRVRAVNRADAGALPPPNRYSGAKIPGVQGDPPTQGLGDSSALDKARAAIAKGAPRDKVLERLKEQGIDPAGL